MKTQIADEFLILKDHVSNVLQKRREPDQIGKDDMMVSPDLLWRLIEQLQVTTSVLDDTEQLLSDEVRKNYRLEKGITLEVESEEKL